MLTPFLRSKLKKRKEHKEETDTGAGAGADTEVIKARLVCRWQRWPSLSLRRCESRVGLLQNNPFKNKLLTSHSLPKLELSCRRPSQEGL
jgi:hypothetical protein